jgi:hypothetical protein
MNKIRRNTKFQHNNTSEQYLPAILNSFPRFFREERHVICT